MARSGTATRERARAAFIELIRQRERPTVAKLREIIGGGGTDLLQSIIREMEDELYQKMFDVANRADVPGDVVDMIVKAWDMANRRADERYAASRQENEHRVQTAEEVKRALLDKNEAQERRIEALESQLATKTGEAAFLRTSLDTAEGRITALTTQLRQRDEDVERIRTDGALRIRQADNHAAEQIKLAEERYQGLERQLMNNFDRDRTRLAQELERVTKDLAASESHVHQLRNELSEHKHKLASVVAERDRLKRNAEKPWKRRLKQHEA